MNKQEIKRLARNFLQKNKAVTENLEDVKQYITDQGFTLVEFSNFDAADADAAIVIRGLKLEQQAAQEKGFLYADTQARLVFLNRDLNEQEKMLVLLHELGHIVCKHFKQAGIFGYNVTDEAEANYFVHCVLNPSLTDKLMVYGKTKRKGIIYAAAAVFFIVAAGGFYVYQTKEASYYGQYVVTASGKKYHLENCVIVKNRNNVRRVTTDEVESGKYKPCKICLPK